KGLLVPGRSTLVRATDMTQPLQSAAVYLYTAQSLAELWASTMSQIAIDSSWLDRVTIIHITSLGSYQTSLPAGSHACSGLQIILLRRLRRARRMAIVLI